MSPKVQTGACIEYSTADEFGLAQADYYRETKEQAASARGWTFLEPAEFSEGNTRDYDYQYVLSGGTLEDLGSGRYRDESGQIWLAVGETGACTQSFGEFVIDKELSVFEVAVSRVKPGYVFTSSRSLFDSQMMIGGGFLIRHLWSKAWGENWVTMPYLDVNAFPGASKFYIEYHGGVAIAYQFR